VAFGESSGGPANSSPAKRVLIGTSFLAAAAQTSDDGREGAPIDARLLTEPVADGYAKPFRGKADRNDQRGDRIGPPPAERRSDE
jgi:hypothetical protein